MAADLTRLLLLSYDEVRVLQDAMRRYRVLLGEDPGDPDLETAVTLHGRLGDLLSVEYERLASGTKER